MVIQSSMGAHQLDVRYGDRNTLPYYNGVVSQTLLDDVDLLVGLITAGRVMSLNTSKRLVVGVQVASDATGSQVPFYAWSGYDTNNYPDVYRTTGMPNVGELPVGGLGAPGSPGFWGVPVASGPGSTADVFATIQHIAAAELSTTEFDTTASYVPGQALTCVSTAATGADKLSAGKRYRHRCRSCCARWFVHQRRRLPLLGFHPRVRCWNHDSDYPRLIGNCPGSNSPRVTTSSKECIPWLCPPRKRISRSTA
jgi:hypothetical protein